jgi:hypothetical protein
MTRFFQMLTLSVTALALVLTSSANGADAEKKKKKTDAANPAGYTKVESVDQEKKTFTLIGDTTKYTYTDQTSNYDKIAAGTAVKLTLEDDSKTKVKSVDVAPATPVKKKKANT